MKWQMTLLVSRIHAFFSFIDPIDEETMAWRHVEGILTGGINEEEEIQEGLLKKLIMERYKLPAESIDAKTACQLLSMVYQLFV